MNSTLAKLNDESLNSLKQSELSRTESSAMHAHELAEIKSRLETNNTLIEATASETKELRLQFDVYADLGSPPMSKTDASS